MDNRHICACSGGFLRENNQKILPFVFQNNAFHAMSGIMDDYFPILEIQFPRL